jgi:outer membrane immunogenic protein
MDTLRSGVIGLTLLASVGVAAVADERREPFGYERAAIWQGLYAGVHVGYGESGDASGAVGGGQIGYNWQARQFVYGLEADASLSDISFKETLVIPGIGTASATGSIDFMATVRGRVGVLITPRVLAYATAGVGFVSGEGRAQVNALGQQIGASVSDSATGLAYGIGLEGRLTETMSARIEYLAITNIDNVAGDGVGVIRAGLNFKLGQ